jgi:uroporphyrinogen-III synthase
LARAASDANIPATQLAAMGAEVVFYPCWEVLPPENLAELDRTLQHLAAGDFDWLVLPTASAVVVLAERMERIQIPLRAVQKTRIAAFGANTRHAAHELLHLDLNRTPETTTHEEMVRFMRLTPGSRVLLPLAAGVRTDWVQLLRDTGAQVTAIAAYRAVMSRAGDEVPAMLWSGDIDAIAFTSETNVRYFAKRLQVEGGTLAMLDDVCVACIEPQTAAAARALGIHVNVVPRDHTAEALAAALATHFAQSRR